MIAHTTHPRNPKTRATLNRRWYTAGCGEGALTRFSAARRNGVLEEGEGSAVAIYHLTVKTGSRHSGQSAGASSDYITRQGRYASDAAELVYTSAGNMPAWAQADPGKYWKAADEYERANGRLFISVEFALPKELNRMQQIELAKHYLERTCGRQPYQFAIHKGDGTNPHCHVLISERTNDGINRSPENWFLRANKAAPEKGGAIKNRQLKSADWLLNIREKWANSINNYLAYVAQIKTDKVDHRSHAARGIEAAPAVHMGPATAAVLRKLDSQIAAAEAREVMAITKRWIAAPPAPGVSLASVLSKAPERAPENAELARYAVGLPDDSATRQSAPERPREAEQQERPQRRYSRDDGPSR